MSTGTIPTTAIRPEGRAGARPDPLQVAVIIGSTRPGRRGGAVAAWLLGQLSTRADMVVDCIDLLEVALPATLPDDTDPAAVELTRRVDAADAFIVITPEYNHGYPASLKQAIDVPYTEWNAKPVAFVSYGGMSGGSRAVEQLRQVFAELHAVTIRDGVVFPGVGVDDDGTPADADTVNGAASVMFDQLAWWAENLRTARARRPYGSSGPAVPTGHEVRGEITDVFTALTDGFNTKDVDTVVRNFAEDTVVVSPAGTMVAGREDLRRYQEARLGGPAATWQTTYHVLDTTPLDDRAVVVHTRQDTTTPDGPFANHGTFVLVEIDGRWLIAAAHNTNIEDGA